MTTSRQRKRQKSGSSSSSRSKRAVQKRMHRAPSVQGPAALRENWDKKATVRQNFRSLGLLGDLSMRDSGGGEKAHRTANATGTSAGTTIGRAGMAVVQRDENGKIIDVREPTHTRQRTAWGEALHSDEDDDEEEATAADQDDEANNDESDAPEHTEMATRVVETLEEAAKAAQPVQRFTSDHELDWLRRLVIRHGQDVKAMARDRQANVWQKTAGEIRRAIDKAGGLDALRTTSSPG